MKWCYYIDESDKDWDRWVPRIVFADGMISHSFANFMADDLEEARTRIAAMNWRSGISQHDYMRVLGEALKHNASLTYEEYWKKGERDEMAG